MADVFALIPPDLHNKAALAAALLCVLLVLSVSRRFPLLHAIVLLPSTLLHELSHLIAGFLTGGRPSGFSVVPGRRESRTLLGGLRVRWVLGSVTLSRPGFLSCFPTGFAPLGLLPLAWLVAQTSLFPATPYGTFVRWIVAAIAAGGAVPSRQDITVAFSRLGGAIFYCAVIAAGCLWSLAR